MSSLPFFLSSSTTQYESKGNGKTKEIIRQKQNMEGEGILCVFSSSSSQGTTYMNTFLPKVNFPQSPKIKTQVVQKEFWGFSPSQRKQTIDIRIEILESYFQGGKVCVCERERNHWISDCLYYDSSPDSRFDSQESTHVTLATSLVLNFSPFLMTTTD